jgi:hypothetical protein
MTTAPEVATANSRNRMPVVPDWKAMGRKTATSVMVIAMTAVVI